MKPIYNLEVNENEDRSITINKVCMRSSKGTEYFTIAPNLISRLEAKYKVVANKPQNLIGFFFNFNDFILDSELKSFFLAGLCKTTTTSEINNYLSNTLHLDVKVIIKNNIEENTIARVVIAQRDMNNPLNLNFIEPKINNGNVILLDIEKECYPEDLYIKNQVLVSNIPTLKDKMDLLDFISDKYGKLRS